MSYVDLSYANTYFGARVGGTVWESATDAQKNAALASASDKLDVFALTRGGWKQDYTTDTPAPIKLACCQEALALLDADAQQRARLIRQGVTSVSIGGASESYASRPGYAILAIPSTRALLAPYLTHHQGTVAIR